MDEVLTIIGGGLAGSEAAWQAANLGVRVRLIEMRPVKNTPAHISGFLAELVCSNSLGADQVDRAPGLLKAELRGFRSLILTCAEASAVPAGKALAVDREIFARLVTESIEGHSLIEVVREEAKFISQGPCIIASGPLTSDALAGEIGALTGEDYLHFYDAVSPIVNHESVDMGHAFLGSRYGAGEDPSGDYINCPLDKQGYEEFVEALISADQIELRDFEREDASFFEGCLPVEVLARRETEALRYGPLRPVGLVDPHTGSRPHAVVQLRQDNLAGTLYNVVGFQTNLRWGEQRRVLRMIPALARAEFMRYGMMHRNTYINSPELLQPTLQFRGRADLFFAGQIVGAEGYVGNAATGLVAGINGARLIRGEFPVIFPVATMVGAICHYVSHAEAKNFQPMKPNFGLVPMPEHKLGKAQRYLYYSQRSLKQMRRFAREKGLAYDPEVVDLATELGATVS